MPAAIENVPNVVKKAMNAFPAASASSIASALSGLDLEPELLRHRLKQGDDLVRERGSGDVSAAIRDERRA